MSFKVILADSEPVIHAGVRSYFQSSSELEIAAETYELGNLSELTAHWSPNLLILETVFPEGNAFGAVENLRQGGFGGAILFYTSERSEWAIIRAKAAGADSYLFKTALPEKFLRTVLALGKKGASRYRESARFSAGGELNRLRQPSRRGRKKETQFPLTEREIQILRYAAEGFGNKEIAALLDLSVDTVKEHIGNIIRRLNANDRTSAAVIALKNGIIS